MLVLGCDPALTTFAFSHIRIKDDGRGLRVESSGFIPSVKTLRNLTNRPRLIKDPRTIIRVQPSVKQSVKALRSVFSQMLDLEGVVNGGYLTPSLVAFERFQARGPQAGASVEYVSFMNGILSSLCSANGIAIRAVMASEWKGAFNRADPVGMDLDAAYAAAKKHALLPHSFDSAAIAVYSSSVFEVFPKEAFMRLLPQLAEAVNGWADKD